MNGIGAIPFNGSMNGIGAIPFKGMNGITRQGGSTRARAGPAAQCGLTRAWCTQAPPRNTN